MRKIIHDGDMPTSILSRARGVIKASFYDVSISASGATQKGARRGWEVLNVFCSFVYRFVFDSP
ncbi:hypothetical protein QCD79_29350, partial [Pseudomonas quasicaspiana]|nr:hypothetical protein [Pseudomonas quasicaspiana]